MSDQGSMALTWMKTLELGVTVRQGVIAKRDDVLLFTNVIGYIFIERRLLAVQGNL